MTTKLRHRPLGSETRIQMVYHSDRGKKLLKLELDRFSIDHCLADEWIHVLSGGLDTDHLKVVIEQENRCQFSVRAPEDQSRGVFLNISDGRPGIANFGGMTDDWVEMNWSPARVLSCAPERKLLLYVYDVKEIKRPVSETVPWDGIADKRQRLHVFLTSNYTLQICDHCIALLLKISDTLVNSTVNAHVNTGSLVRSRRVCDMCQETRLCTL